MKARVVLALLGMLGCAWWGCADRIEQRRAALSAEWRAGRNLTTCQVGCQRDHQTCLTKRRHAAGACWQHFADCDRDCGGAR